MARVLIAGCGDVGGALGSLLAADGDRVWGLSRRGGTAREGIEPLRADLTAQETLWALPRGLDFAVYTAAADERTDIAYRAAYVEGLRNLLDALCAQGQRVRRVFFTSSTGVYGQRDGEWVDEASATEPEHFSGRRLLEGEALLAASAFPATVVRLAGIYGPGRTRLIDRVRSRTAVRPAGPPRFTNRIHRDDCAGVLRHLLRREGRGEPVEALYVGVDCEPAPLGEVLSWLAARLGVEPPPVGPAPERPRGSKRCSNARLLASGYRFGYPTFRDGYGQMLRQTGEAGA